MILFQSASSLQSLHGVWVGAKSLKRKVHTIKGAPLWSLSRVSAVISSHQQHGGQSQSDESSKESVKFQGNIEKDSNQN